MFKDTKEGTTHYQNDGCGEPAHNNPILKAHLEGVTQLENTFLIEEGIKQREIDVHIRYDVVKRFLTTYGINLLKAAKKAGPGEEDEKIDAGVGEYTEVSPYGIGFNDCRTSFHSAIDEGIKEIEKGDK